MIHPHDIYHNLEPWTVRITYLAQELIKFGHEVKLIYHLFKSDIDVLTAIKRQDFPFETIPFHRIGPGLGRRCFEIEKLGAWADIIHFQKCIYYVSIPAVFSAYYHRKPVHYDWDDWEQKIYEQDEFSRLGSWVFFQQLEKHLLKLVDTVSVSSNGLRQLSKRYGFPQKRIFYVPVGADLENFSPLVDGTTARQRHDWKKHLVLYHGQISGANYIHLFLHAAQIILSYRRDVSFVVVGGGDRLDDAKNLANRLEIAGDLTFTDKIPHTEVPAYIAAADVTVACFENNAQARCKSPLKLIEYMASGKAIVASQMGEVPNMLGDCGLLVEPGSSDAIAKGIDKLLNDPDLRKREGRKARKRAEQAFSWEKSALTLIEAYQNALCVRYGLN